MFEAFEYEVGYTSGMVALEKNLEANGSEALEFAVNVHWEVSNLLECNAAG